MGTNSFKIDSSKLNKTVLVAEDREAARDLWKAGARGTIYLFQEVQAMLEIDEESLKAVQLVKEVFPGSIVEKIREPGSDVPPCKPLPAPKTEAPKQGRAQESRQMGLYL